ncbi:MAG TPA: sulfur carrier protein ThiS [Thermoanaerobaculia bacterium]|nr:sulfur carrier protein ThiS [Thermoanaerobaculia bacterium]
MTTDTLITLTLNGATREFPSRTTVSQMLEMLGMQPELVAVEINRELVRKRDFASRTIAAGDQIEVVEFVGGG